MKVQIEPYLNDENNSQDGPLLPVGKAKPKLFIAVILSQLVLVVGAELFQFLSISRAMLLPNMLRSVVASSLVLGGSFVSLELLVGAIEVRLVHDLRRILGEMRM